MQIGKVFETDKLPLAVFIHTRDALPFLGVKEGRPGRMVFEFQDPDGQGPQLELEFQRGAEVSASALFASYKYLRSALSKATSNQNNGESKYGRNNYASR